MKYSVEVCLVTAMLSTAMLTRVAGQTAPISSSSSFVGTWQGQENGLPVIKLKLNRKDTNVTGNIVFYLQKRPDGNRPWHVVGKTTDPLLAPRVDGRTLTFEVRHHRCHGCADFGPNVKFRMILDNSNRARIWNISENDRSPGLLLMRTRAAGTVPPRLQTGIREYLPDPAMRWHCPTQISRTRSSYVSRAMDANTCEQMESFRNNLY